MPIFFIYISNSKMTCVHALKCWFFIGHVRGGDVKMVCCGNIKKLFLAETLLKT